MGTHTFAELELSPAAYDEIAAELRKVGYDHAFMHDGAIDMHGIGVTRKAEPVAAPVAKGAQLWRGVLGLRGPTQPTADEIERAYRVKMEKTVVPSQRDVLATARNAAMAEIAGGWAAP